MRKSTFVIGALVAVAVVAAGGLFASNMGFKLNFRLPVTGEAVPSTPGSPDADGLAQTGTVSLALPYNRQAGIDNAQDLIDDINASGGSALNVQRFLEVSDTPETYSGAKGETPFDLVPGEAVFVRVNAGLDYIVVGSHDPSLAVPLETTGAGSQTGTNFFSVPYHTTAADAQDLIDSIGPVLNVQRFYSDTDTVVTYSGAKGETPFGLVSGEGYFVRMSTTTNHVPVHF